MQSFTLSINYHIIGHGSLSDINEAITAIQKLRGADDTYLGGDHGRIVHETQSDCFQLKIESCDVLTYSQKEDAVEAAKQNEDDDALEKALATQGYESDSLEPARS